MVQLILALSLLLSVVTGFQAVEFSPAHVERGAEQSISVPVRPEPVGAEIPDGIFGQLGPVLSESERYVYDLAISVLNILENEDWGALGAMVHPTEGLTFSPYAHIDTKNAVKLGAGDVKALGIDEQVRVWGSFDGSGHPIEMTFTEYYGQFILTHDFVRALHIGVNRLVVKGNSPSNLQVLGNGVVFVEYHVPGSEGEGAFDWASLRLVFSGYEGELYLVGIVHDQWTI